MFVNNMSASQFAFACFMALGPFTGVDAMPRTLPLPKLPLRTRTHRRPQTPMSPSYVVLA